MIKNFYLIDHRLLVLGMIAVLVAASETGRQLGLRKVGSAESFRSMMSGIGAAQLGLLGLLLGFTLSMAIARWDGRHQAIVTEANAIGTLWLRGGLLEEPLRGELRSALRDYADARIAMSGSREDGEDRAALRTAPSKSERLHQTIWSIVERADGPEMSNAKLSSLIAGANEVIDLHELRIASIENYLPAPLFLMLLGVAALAIAFLAWSFGAASQSGRAALMLLAMLIGAVLALIMDINRPQRGRIEVGFAPLERVRGSMGVPKR